MTANPRDAIERALLADTWTTPSVDHPHPDWHRRFAPWMAALAARIALDALCPPGSRVVVDRTPQPCEACDGMCFDGSCRECRGRGVVEATTTYGLEVAHEVPRGIYFEELFRLVALPEETQ